MNLPENGTIVTAKRAGWNEQLTEVDLLDLEPYEHQGDDDLEGEIFTQEIPADGDLPAFTLVRVNGQPADPETVEVKTDAIDPADVPAPMDGDATDA